MALVAAACHAQGQDGGADRPLTPVACESVLSAAGFDSQSEAPWIGVVELDRGRPAFSHTRLTGLERLCSVAVAGSGVLVAGHDFRREGVVALVGTDAVTWRQKSSLRPHRRSAFTSIQPNRAGLGWGVAGEALGSDGRWAVLAGVIGDQGQWVWVQELQVSGDLRYPTLARTHLGDLVLAAHLLPGSLVVYRFDPAGVVRWRQTVEGLNVASIREVQETGADYAIWITSRDARGRTTLNRVTIGADGQIRARDHGVHFSEMENSGQTAVFVEDSAVVAVRPSGPALVGATSWESVAIIQSDSVPTVPTAKLRLSMRAVGLARAHGGRAPGDLWLAGWSRDEGGRPVTKFVRIRDQEIHEVLCVDLGWSGPEAVGFSASDGRLVIGGGNLEGRPR